MFSINDFQSQTPGFYFSLITSWGKLKGQVCKRRTYTGATQQFFSHNEYYLYINRGWLSMLHLLCYKSMFIICRTKNPNEDLLLHIISNETEGLLHIKSCLWYTRDCSGQCKQDAFQSQRNTAHVAVGIPPWQGQDIILTKYPHSTYSSSTGGPGGGWIRPRTLFRCLALLSLHSIQTRTHEEGFGGCQVCTVKYSWWSRWKESGWGATNTKDIVRDQLFL